MTFTYPQLEMVSCGCRFHRREQGPVLILTSFAPRCIGHANQIKDTLHEAGVPCELGEDLGGLPISEGVRKKIMESSLIIGLLERPNGRTWKPAEWVLLELEFARAVGKRCVSFFEQGVQFSRKLLSDIEFIPFKTNDFSSIFPRIFSELNTKLGIKRPFEPWFYVTEDDVESDCEDAAFHRQKARKLARQAQYIGESCGDEVESRKLLDLACKHAEEAITLDPNNWPGLITFGGILVESGHLDAGHAIYVSVLEKFAHDNRACAAAHHNLGSELERRFPSPRTKKIMREIVRHYECSFRLDSSRAATRAPLICFYLRLGKVREAQALLSQSAGNEEFRRMMTEELHRSPDRGALFTLLEEWAQNLFYPLNGRALDQSQKESRQ